MEGKVVKCVGIASRYVRWGGTRLETITVSFGAQDKLRVSRWGLLFRSNLATVGYGACQLSLVWFVCVCISIRMCASVCSCVRLCRCVYVWRKEERGI